MMARGSLPRLDGGEGDFAVRYGATKPSLHPGELSRCAEDADRASNGPDVTSIRSVLRKVALPGVSLYCLARAASRDSFASGSIRRWVQSRADSRAAPCFRRRSAQIQKREPETHARLIAQLSTGRLRPIKPRVGKVVAFEEISRSLQDHAIAVALGK